MEKPSTLLYEESPLLLLADERRFARIQAYTAGCERELPTPIHWVAPAIGGQFTVHHVPPQLAPIYGVNPVGIQLFLRFRVGQGPK